LNEAFHVSILTNQLALKKNEKMKKSFEKKMKKKPNYNVEVGSVVFYDNDAYKKFKKSVKEEKNTTKMFMKEK
jgi:hypothetical protein